jgi:hypothetical protein
MNRRNLSLVVLASGWLLLALSSGLAAAHGNTKPLHGGIVQMVGEMSFELVARPEGVEVYLVDDGEPVGTGGLDAKITIARDGATTEAALVGGGGNRLVGAGVQVPPGSRVTVIVTMKANAARWAAKFTIK